MDEVKEMLKNYYDVSVSSLTVLNDIDHRVIYKVDSLDKSYILRCYESSRTQDQVNRDAAIFDYLELYNFPASRLIRDLSGKVSVRFKDRIYYLLTFIKGKHPELNEETMRKIGILAANLHKLGEEHAYGVGSAWSSSSEKEKFLNQFRNKEYEKLDFWQEISPKLVKGFQDLPDFYDLPQTVIHTDIRHKNIIETKGGDYVLVDWDGAGKGAAIIDVGYVLAYRGVIFGNETTVRPELKLDWCEAFLKGYQSIRKLSAKEIEMLPFALKFTALTYVFESWVPRIKLQNWIRYQKVDELLSKLKEIF